tara:strand:+ start:10258 stop:11442 length:1185 start_codon:yes stop_codon:yes gene_type:complete
MKKYSGNELTYLKKVLNNQKPKSGTWNAELEKKFSEKFKGKYAIAMNSGTATLHTALEALGVKAGDEVISPSLTVIMDTTATLHANAIPVYADVDRATYNITASEIEKKITKKTKAIIVVSLYGLPCDMGPIMKLSRKYKIPVIEDHAQTVLAKVKNKTVGITGDFASWSFETSKHISSGEGGILLTNKKTLAEKARKIGGQGYANLNADGGVIKFGNNKNFLTPSFPRHDTLGWNYRMNEFTAAVALAQLEKVEEKVEQRRYVARKFIEVIENFSTLKLQHIPNDYTHSFFTLACTLENKKIKWEDFRDKFNFYGGDSFYAAWQNPYKEKVIANEVFKKRNFDVYKNIEYKNISNENAEILQQKIIQFKTNYLKESEVKKQQEALLKTLKYFN